MPTTEEINAKMQEILDVMQDPELSEEEITKRLESYSQTDPEAYQDIVGGIASLPTSSTSPVQRSIQEPPPAV